ncbi:MAG: hypothetical protein R3A50_17520 [Saprospiraceae bacterium]
MTLRELFDYLHDNPFIVLAYFLLIPIVALFAGFASKNEGHKSPWRYLYSAIVFMVCVPGIFAAALAVYLFLFERGGSIFNVNLLTQVLPILSMVITLGIIKRNISFAYIPGFGKLSDLIMMIASVFIVMYLLDRLHLIAWVNLPVIWLLIIVVAFLIVFRFALKRMMS